MFKNYFKIAIRNINKHKGYSFVNIIGLAIALCAVMLILLFVNHEINFNRFHEKGDRIYRLRKTGFGSTEFSPSMPAPLAPAMKSEFPEIEDASRFAFKNNVHISANEKHFFEDGFVFTDPSTFSIFTFTILEGNVLTALDDPFAILISESMSKKYFGSENPIGKTITYKRAFDFKVSGIFQDLPNASSIDCHFAAPFTTLEKMDSFYSMKNWGAFSYHTYLLLSEGSSSKALENKIPGMLERNMGVDRAGQISLSLQPLYRIHTDSRRTIILLFTGISILVLLIACINYINLTTARAVQRIDEIGMRKVVGANRSQLILQFLGESMLITFIAFAIAVLLAIFFLPSFCAFVGRDLMTYVEVNREYLLWMIALLLFVGIFAGFYPALAISSNNLIQSIRGTIGGSKKSGFRNSLVVFQFVVSIVLIVSTLVIKSQLNFIASREMGFQKNNIIAVDFRDKRLRNNLKIIQNELINNPKIQSVSASYFLPNYTDCATTIEWPGMAKGEEKLIYLNFVDYTYADLYDLQIVRGRNFSKDFSTDETGAFLLNESAVKMFGWDSPIDKELNHHMGGGKGKVVGIVKDFHMNPLHESIEPLCIDLNPKRARQFLSIRMEDNSSNEVLNAIQTTFNQFAPDYPFAYRYFSDIIENSYAFENKLQTILSLFSILAISIACMGLFSLVALAAQQRTKEIGIRKVFGAKVTSVVFLLVRQFTKWVIISNCIAWPVAYLGLRKALQLYAYKIPLTITFFLIGGGIIFIIAVLSVSYQSIKVAMTNPIESLRYE